jgi:uncharacterized protein (TIGR02118 family)
MAFVHEIALTGAPAMAQASSKWFANAADRWCELAGISALDCYRPVDGIHDPYNRDEGPPLLLVVAEFHIRAALSSAVPALARELAHVPAGTRATVTPMERRFYSVADEAAPGPLRAPFSYVVRYHRPAEDEAAFVAHYVADHPGLEARFPRIRSIMCYFPLDAGAAGQLPRADYMLGNEVVFDSIEDFNAAMQSPVRHEMRSHFHSFPKFSGPVTHFAMLRERRMGDDPVAG